MHEKLPSKQSVQERKTVGYLIGFFQTFKTHLEIVNFIAFHITFICLIIFATPNRRQLKTLLTIDERWSKIARNSVFDCRLSPFGRQMAMKTLFLAIFDLSSSIVLMFSIVDPVCIQEFTVTVVFNSHRIHPWN